MRSHHHRKNDLLSALFPGFLVVACGCSAFKKVEASGLERAPTFSVAALAENGIVIGAVACSKSERLVRETSSAELASDLRERLRVQLPVMEVLMPERVEQALGAEEYLAWTRRLQEAGDPGTEVLREIHSALHESVRYVLLARIERDSIERHQSDHQVQEANGKWESDGTDYVTARSTRVVFHLYDLETGTLEWKGKLETSNSRSNWEPDEDGLLGVLEAVDAVLGDSDPPYPEPVPIQVQTDQIFDAFVETLLAEEED